MKKSFTILMLSCLLFSIKAQVPSSFTWKTRHGNFNYISDPKEQWTQGPCGVFATVAAVEAMSQIYYNDSIKNHLDLSEAYVWNDNSQYGCTGLGCESADPVSVLNFAVTTGLIQNDCFLFPEHTSSCIIDCSSYYPACVTQRVLIPNYGSSSWEIFPEDDEDLKQAILDYGPIIMMPAAPNAHALHSGAPTNIHHTVLFIGWNSTQWHIKDSWLDTPTIEYKTYSVFSYQPHFYRVFPVNPNNGNDLLRCQGSNCGIFNGRRYYDKDNDGFYNWGLDSYQKPSGCPGPDLMDWDDGDENHIFRVGSTIVQTPTISGSTDLLCTSDGSRVFTLTDIPDGFSTPTWSISKNPTCFNSPTSGTGNSATIYPNSSCIGKQCEITFSISHNGTASYKKSFYLNGPREDLVSISVIDSYGGSPAKYGDTYYLCPNTTYMIYYNNYDNSCTTWDFSWVLPYGWTEHYRSANYVSINTNDYPDGYLEVWARTSCCSENLRVEVLNPFFGAAECGGYFIAFPNPSNNSLEININKSKASEDLNMASLLTDAEWQLTIVDKSGFLKYKTEFKGFPYKVDTSNLQEGLYFLNLMCNNKKSTIRIVIKH